VGDETDALILDAESGKTVSSLSGHVDYSFACAWSPDSRYVATGNQDKTCRVYDTRNLSTSIYTLGGRMGAIRSIRFSSDSRYMAYAEPVDFVHLVDTLDWKHEQELDFFGEIAGISFSPDSDGLYISNADNSFGSLLEFHKRQHVLY
jgi:WD40 repeat protein